MADNYGVSFAPTQDNAQQGPLNGQIDGLPAAIKILALRFPKFFGGGVAPQQLMTARGGGGIDPVASAVLATMAKVLGQHSLSGGGGRGPDSPSPLGPMPLPGMPTMGGNQPAMPGMPGQPAPNFGGARGGGGGGYDGGAGAFGGGGGAPFSFGTPHVIADTDPNLNPWSGRR